MSETNVAYSWYVDPDSDTPIQPGRWEMLLVEGGTYRNLASRRKFTVVEMNPEQDTIKYRYTRGNGESVERTGNPNELAVVEAVDDTPGGIVNRPEGVLG